MPDLKDDLRTYFDALATLAERNVTIPPPPGSGDGHAGNDTAYVAGPPQKRRLKLLPILAAAAAIIALLGVVSVVLRDDRRGQVKTEAPPGPMIGVRYERDEYSQRADLSCERLPAQGRFDVMTIESWEDTAGKRWRTQVTYPDGSTRDVIVEGSPWYPSARYTRGAVLGAAHGCTDDRIDIVLQEQSQQDLWMLDPRATDPGYVPGTSSKLLSTYKDEGVLVPGTHRDSRGRRANLWRYSNDWPAEENQGIAISQTDEWFVTDDGQMLEMSSLSQYGDLGKVSSHTTLIEADHREVPHDWFDTAGYRAHDGTGIPNNNGSTLPPKPTHTVTGTLKMIGGPTGAADTPTDGTVSALDDTGTVLRTVPADEIGQFAMELPAGTYELTGHSPHYNSGYGTSASDGPVVVTDRNVPDVLVVCLRR